MTERRLKIVTHRAVSNSRARKIADEPQMKRLKEIMTGMDDTGRVRTQAYLHDEAIRENEGREES